MLAAKQMEYIIQNKWEGVSMDLRKTQSVVLLSIAFLLLWITSVCASAKESQSDQATLYEQAQKILEDGYFLMHKHFFHR